MTAPTTRAKKGTGTIFERPSGWHCQWSSRDPGTGARRVHKKGAFKTEREARKYLTAQLAKVDAGTFVPAPKPKPLGEVLDAWLASKTEVRPTTLDGYTTAVEKWIRPRLGGVRLPALTEQQVRDFAAELAEKGGRRSGPLSPRSVQLALVTLKQALAFAIDQGWATRNVAAKVRTRTVRTTMRTWTSAQARAFLASIADDRLLALYTLAVTRGMRRGEIAGLKWDAVDLEAGHLTINTAIVLVGGRPQVSQPKTAAGRRRVPLDPKLLEVLRAHRRRQLQDRLAAGTAWADTGYVFTNEIGEPLHPEHISNRWDTLVAASGQPRIRLHDARHTAASLMLGAGIATKVVSEMIGHSDPRITLSIYAHVLPGMGDDAGAALSAMVL